MDRDLKQALPKVSDALMEQAEAVRDLERRRRDKPTCTPEFHRVSDEIEMRARDVLRLAHEQELLGVSVPTSDESIDDVAREQLP